MQYVFQDKYRETPQHNKTGLTKLNFIREQHPGFWRKVLWRRGRLTEYSGSFDSFERNIDGTIIGTRLDRDAARNSRSEAGRLEILANDVSRPVDTRQKTADNRARRIVRRDSTKPTLERRRYQALREFPPDPPNHAQGAGIFRLFSRN
jgi:hypothetical protein